MHHGLRGVHEPPTEPHPIVHIVAAPAPLPPLHRPLPLAGHVARAVREISRRTGFSHAVNHART